METTIRANKITIREIADKWVVYWGFDNDEYSTAAEALRAVVERDTKIGEGGISMITTIVWETTTKIGQQVVMALQ